MESFTENILKLQANTRKHACVQHATNMRAACNKQSCITTSHAENENTCRIKITGELTMLVTKISNLGYNGARNDQNLIKLYAVK